MKEIQRQSILKVPQDSSNVFTGRSTIKSLEEEEDEEKLFYRPGDEDYQGYPEPSFGQDFSKKYGEHISEQLSGRGLRFDSLESSKHVVDALSGGALSDHKSELLNTYISGTLHKATARSRRKPVTNFQVSGEYRRGGSLQPSRFLEGKLTCFFSTHRAHPMRENV